MFNPEHPTLKSRIAAGECLAVSWLALGSVALVEAAARARPDAIVIDMQHGLWERRELESAIGVVPHAIPVVVRVAENSALAIGTALDAGAEGVMVPMVETALDTERAIRYAKYPPHGVRSGGGVRPLQDFGAYLRGASEIAVLVMIETADGVANAKAIARASGLDMVFIGTGDLALSLQTHAGEPKKHARACANILRACQAASLPCGIFTGTPQSAAEYRGQGYGMVVVASDLDVVMRGFAGAGQDFRQATTTMFASDKKSSARAL
jgi:2-dehydro-3-deoxyglucarate aldolase/4-hydroxy-2-oxoheptanedioate aldolase